jgi:hypothetical protein
MTNPNGELDTRPWWQLEPDDLAARFGWDAEALINPEDFNDQQAAPTIAAIDRCLDRA